MVGSIFSISAGSWLSKILEQIDDVELVVIGNSCNKMALINRFDAKGVRIDQRAVKICTWAI